MKQIFTTYPSVSQSSKSNTSFTLEEALDFIKNNPHKKDIEKARALGKYDLDKSYTINSFGKQSHVNYYNFLKTTKIPMVTWNHNFNGITRSIKNVETSRLTGYIYFDIDSFDKLISMPNNGISTPEEAKERSIVMLKSFKFVKAIWNSFGGEGLGFLVKTNNLTIDNFKTTWDSIAKMLLHNINLEVDSATKDITRPNIFSFDSEIFIREEEKMKTYEAVEPEQIVKTRKITNITVLSKGKLASKFETIFTNLYDNSDYHTDNRLTYNFFTSIAGAWNTINQGVEKDEIIENLMNLLISKDNVLKGAIFNHRDENEVEAIITKIIQMYDNDTEDYVESKTVEIKISNEVIVPKGKYLSDVLKIDDILGKLLISYTGSGKTHFVLNGLKGRKTIFVVPKQALCVNLNAEHSGSHVFYEKSKDISINSDLIFTTYASLPNLVKELNSMDIDLSEYNLVLDEWHTSISDASITFAYSAYSKAADVIKNKEFKTRTYLTATPVYSCNNSIEVEAIKCIPEVARDINMKILKTKDYTNEYMKIAKETQDGKSFVVSLLNDKKTKLDKMLAINETIGNNVIAFNADVQNTKEIMNILQTGLIPNGINGYITTPILSEGTSLYLGDERANKVTIFVHGSMSSLQIYQAASRIRDGKKIEIILVKNDKWDIDNKMNFCAKKLADKLLEISYKNLVFFRAMPESLKPQLGKGFLEKIEKSYVKFDYITKRVVIAYTMIDNEIFEKQTIAENNDLEFLKTQFAQYGINFKGIIENTSKVDINTKETIEAKVIEKKIERLDFEEEILEQIKYSGLFTNNFLLNNKTYLMSNTERDIRYKMDYIYKNSDICKKGYFDIVSIYNSIGKSKQAFALFIKQTNMLKTRKGLFSMEKGAKEYTKNEYMFIHELDEELKTGTIIDNKTVKTLNSLINKYRKSDIIQYCFKENSNVEVVQKIKSRNKIKLNMKQALAFLKICYSLKKTTTTQLFDGTKVKVHIHKIVDNNPSKMTIDEEGFIESTPLSYNF